MLNVVQFPAGRQVPSNVEAEQGILGAILTSNRAYERVGGLLRPEHFYDPVHGRIYEAAERLIAEGRVADPVTLHHTFNHDPALAHVGGAGYLAELVGSVVSLVNAEHYAKVVRDCALRRRLVDLGTEVATLATGADPDTAPADIIGRAETELFRLAETGTAAKPRRSYDFAREYLRDVVAAQEAPDGLVGLSTGLRDLDAVVGGLRGPDLIIIAGRPGMGKTSLAKGISRHVADRGGRPLFVSQEMSGKQLVARDIADVTGISVQDQRRGKLSPDEMRRIFEAVEAMVDVREFIEETPSLSIAAVRSIARRHKRRHGLDLLVVDYLQLLSGLGGDGRPENRVQEISTISRGLKAIAKELDVPVIALSQLSRAVEGREDKRPKLSDLRESGSIEADADMVWFPFRLEYYLGKEEPVRRSDESGDRFAERHLGWINAMAECQGRAEIIIAKFREGDTASIPVAFDGARTRFSDLYRGGR
jgi:replicative DNA helicase